MEWARYDGCQACNYYRCREQVAQCGEEGYLLGYVGRYCDRFSTVTEPVLSPRGAEWMKKVRRGVRPALTSTRSSRHISSRAVIPISSRPPRSIRRAARTRSARAR